MTSSVRTPNNACNNHSTTTALSFVLF